MARIKKKVFANVTLEQAQDASELVAVNQNKLEKIEAKMNEEINRIKSKYTDDINELTEALEEPTAILKAYATEQAPSWGKKKSFELLHCIIGFRTGTPKVDKKKGFTWEAVLELLKKKKAFEPFVRVKEEINKDAILQLSPDSDTDRKTLTALEKECYIEIKQDESFYVTPKKEEVAA